MATGKRQQPFDYFLVLDFEATCDANCPQYPSEIIEFPVVAVDAATLKPIAEFRSFVRPVKRPQLTAFCTQLTGITQDQVSNAPTLKQVIKQFMEWVLQTFPVGSRLIFATDGPWDLRVFLHRNAVLRDKHVVPTLFYRYVDVRNTFGHFMRGGKGQKLRTMLKDVGLEFSGREHSGIDDARNIARLLIELARRGCHFDFVCRIKPDSRSEVFPPWETKDALLRRFVQQDEGTSNPKRFAMYFLLAAASTVTLIAAALSTGR